MFNSEVVKFIKSFQHIRHLFTSAVDEFAHTRGASIFGLWHLSSSKVFHQYPGVGSFAYRLLCVCLERVTVGANNVLVSFGDIASLYILSSRRLLSPLIFDTVLKALVGGFFLLDTLKIVRRFFSRHHNLL